MTYPPNAPMPPAAPTPAPAGKAAPTGWLGVAAGIFGLLALVLPWYHPKFTKNIPGASINANPYHAWTGLVILVVGPIALIAFAAIWLQALIGRTNARFANSTDPHRSIAMQSIGAGVLALVAALLSYPLVKSHYKDWNDASSFAKAHGSALSRGVQPGLWLLILGGVLMALAGVLGMVLKRSAPPAAAGPGYGFAPQQDPVQQQYPPQQAYPQQQEYPQQQYPPQQEQYPQQ